MKQPEALDKQALEDNSKMRAVRFKLRGPIKTSSVAKVYPSADKSLQARVLCQRKDWIFQKTL